MNQTNTLQQGQQCLNNLADKIANLEEANQQLIHENAQLKASLIIARTQIARFESEVSETIAGIDAQLGMTEEERENFEV